MRRLRWKPKYLTGDPQLDRLHRDLVQLTSALGAELEHQEHCQELNELVAALTETVHSGLEAGRRPSNPTEPAWAAVRPLLAVGFPLATRSSPACRDCGLCDRLKDQVDAWLSDAEAVGPQPGAEPEMPSAGARPAEA